MTLPISMGAVILGLAAAASALAAGAIEVRQPWLRSTVPGQQAAGGYLSLTNRGAAADRLQSVRSEVAAQVELHAMSMDGDVMRMRQLPAIELPAGATVALQPGGLHLMLLGLKRPLKAGDSVPLTLSFEKAGELQLRVPVSAAAPAR